MARAVYSRKTFVILDDVFSGLDNKTSRAVFQRLLGSGGLLRNDSQTVVLATNNGEKNYSVGFAICLTHPQSASLRRQITSPCWRKVKLSATRCSIRPLINRTGVSTKTRPSRMTPHLRLTEMNPVVMQNDERRTEHRLRDTPRPSSAAKQVILTVTNSISSRWDYLLSLLL